MNQQEQKKHLFDNPRNVSLMVRGLYLVCIVLILLDFIVHRHISIEWESFPGFYALFGFIACVAIVLISILLRKTLRRREDYYDVDE
jgi:drug/metabolite transporter (DMT)-like permease